MEPTSASGHQSGSARGRSLAWPSDPATSAPASTPTSPTRSSARRHRDEESGRQRRRAQALASRRYRSLRRRDRIALQPATPPPLTPPRRLGPVGRDEVNHGVEPLSQAASAACDLSGNSPPSSTARMASARLSGSAAVLISPNSRIRSSPWRIASCHRSNAAANAWRLRGSRSLSSPTSDPIGHQCLPSRSSCTQRWRHARVVGLRCCRGQRGVIFGR